MIILDTNVISELFRARPTPEVERWLAEQESTDIYLTAISEAELRYGVAVMVGGKRREMLARAVDGVLREDFRDRILPFESLAAAEFATIAAERRAGGRPISQFDCQIAAIARVHGAPLATRKIDDFAGCGVDVIDPWHQG